MAGWLGYGIILGLISSETDMDALAHLRERKDELLNLARKCGAENLRVFGSVARGEETDDSDIDLLVRWNDQASLTDWVAFQEAASLLLGRKVEIASEASLHWYVRSRILSEAKPLA